MMEFRQLQLSRDGKIEIQFIQICLKRKKIHIIKITWRKMILKVKNSILDKYHLTV
jgi:hypothetical protein